MNNTRASGSNAHRRQVTSNRCHCMQKEKRSDNVKIPDPFKCARGLRHKWGILLIHLYKSSSSVLQWCWVQSTAREAYRYRSGVGFVFFPGKIKAPPFPCWVLLHTSFAVTTLFLPALTQTSAFLLSYWAYKGCCGTAVAALFLSKASVMLSRKHGPLREKLLRCFCGATSCHSSSFPVPCYSSWYYVHEARRVNPLFY